MTPKQQRPTTQKLILKTMNRTRTILCLLSAMIVCYGIYFAFNYGSTAKQAVSAQKGMELTEYENDSVTVEMLKRYRWELVGKYHVSTSQTHTWKLKSGNYVINFYYMPHDVYFKYNVGEIVPNQLIIQLFEVEEKIRETYNLHKNRQGYSEAQVIADRKSVGY